MNMGTCSKCGSPDGTIGHPTDAFRVLCRACYEQYQQQVSEARRARITKLRCYCHKMEENIAYSDKPLTQSEKKDWRLAELELDRLAKSTGYR